MGFTFLTGISKFSKVSLFSQLNDLTDLTLDPVYSSICGYTDGDLDTVFTPELGRAGPGAGLGKRPIFPFQWIWIRWSVRGSFQSGAQISNAFRTSRIVTTANQAA